MAVMEMDDAGFRSTKEFLHRGEIIGRMRDCLLAKELHPGEEVLFVGTEPYGGPGDFELRGGHIRFVDPERMGCRTSRSPPTRRTVRLTAAKTAAGKSSMPTSAVGSWTEKGSGRTAVQ